MSALVPRQLSQHPRLWCHSQLWQRLPKPRQAGGTLPIGLSKSELRLRAPAYGDICISQTEWQVVSQLYSPLQFLKLKEEK